MTIILQPHSFEQCPCEFNQPRPEILQRLLRRQSRKSKPGKKQQTQIPNNYFRKFTELEIIQPFVLLPPKRWNRRWPDLRRAVRNNREVNAEKRIPQIGHWIDVRSQRSRRLFGIQIQSFERQNPV